MAFVAAAYATSSASIAQADAASQVRGESRSFVQSDIAGVLRSTDARKYS